MRYLSSKQGGHVSGWNFGSLIKPKLIAAVSLANWLLIEYRSLIGQSNTSKPHDALSADCIWEENRPSQRLLLKPRIQQLIRRGWLVHKEPMVGRNYSNRPKLLRLHPSQPFFIKKKRRFHPWLASWRKIPIPDHVYSQINKQEY